MANARQKAIIAQVVAKSGLSPSTVKELFTKGWSYETAQHLPDRWTKEVRRATTNPSE
jgi:hypothetical protein